MRYKATVAVAMSGGVDSAVSALLLKNAGYKVFGVFMKNWEDDDQCNSREDFIDAVSVAETLKIDIFQVNFSKDYKKKVFDNFLLSLSSGNTPNPDVFCNSEIKFNNLLNYSLNNGADFLATGHYARKEKRNNKFDLKCPEDLIKDQTYFLYRLNQDQLSKSCFPLYKYNKNQVRKLANEINIEIAKKKDSVGICFVGKRKFSKFIDNYLEKEPGNFEDLDGNLIGKYSSIHNYTIGQKASIPGKNSSWYVVEKNKSEKKILVVNNRNHKSLYKRKVFLRDLNWINEIPKKELVYTGKARYNQLHSPCVISKITDTTVELNFATDQYALTSGQSAVIYDSHNCLGGGIIYDVE